MIEHDPGKDIALVKAGVVIQVARAPCEAAWFGADPDGELLEFDPGVAHPEMLWDGSALSVPPAPEPVVTVPRSVSMRQARLALLSAGLLDTVEGLIAHQPRAVQIEWDYATDIWRSRDLVVTLGAALGLSNAQLDALFIAAAAIP